MEEKYQFEPSIEEVKLYSIETLIRSKEYSLALNKINSIQENFNSSIYTKKNDLHHLVFSTAIRLFDVFFLFI